MDDDPYRLYSPDRHLDDDPFEAQPLTQSDSVMST